MAPHVRRFADAPAARAVAFNFMPMFFCDQKNQKSWGLRDAPKPLNAFKGPAGPLKIPTTGGCYMRVFIFSRCEVIFVKLYSLSYIICRRRIARPQSGGGVSTHRTGNMVARLTLRAPRSALHTGRAKARARAKGSAAMKGKAAGGRFLRPIKTAAPWPRVRLSLPFPNSPLCGSVLFLITVYHIFYGMSIENEEINNIFLCKMCVPE